MKREANGSRLGHIQKTEMYNPAAMRGSNPATFAQVLLAAGVTRKHTKYGNVYLVKPMKAA